MRDSISRTSMLNLNEFQASHNTNGSNALTFVASDSSMRAIVVKDTGIEYWNGNTIVWSK